MIDNSKEYIICAAIWYKDGTEAIRGLIAQNIDSGVVIGQWRHGNCINVRATNPVWNAKKLSERQNGVPMTTEGPSLFTDVQGFLTSKGRFVDRYQAMELAYYAGQVDDKRAFKKDFDGKIISTEEFQNQTPQDRDKTTCNGWNMLYSEDLY